jgi:hypothetical protein
MVIQLNFSLMINDSNADNRKVNGCAEDNFNSAIICDTL